jgi:hypothetical protein
MIPGTTASELYKQMTIKAGAKSVSDSVVKCTLLGYNAFKMSESTLKMEQCVPLKQ